MRFDGVRAVVFSGKNVPGLPPVFQQAVFVKIQAGEPYRCTDGMSGIGVAMTDGRLAGSGRDRIVNAV